MDTNNAVVSTAASSLLLNASNSHHNDDASSNKKVIIVLDTNIFISNLNELKEIASNPRNHNHCQFAVPWIVLQVWITIK
jgi:hypothetical protein